jgi:HK97 family phage prohead protease
MPYFISDSNPDCSGWAVEKEGGEVIGCHDTKESAIDQMVAISIAEGIEPGGERARPGTLDTGDFVSWNSSGGRARGQIEHIMTDGVLGIPNSDFSIQASEDDPAALIRIWREGSEGWEPTEVLVGHKFSTLTKIDSLDDRSEERQVDLTPPAYFRASARRGLQWVDEGRAGDGLLPRTIREARAMAEGNVTADKWVRLRAFLARHMVDFDAPAANPNNEDYPSPGVVAVALWGGGGTRRSAMRALTYAEGVIARLEEENEGRTKGETLNKLETREFEFGLELREEGDEMSLVGYAALFNSRSENLGGFTEVIAPGAFARSLKSRNDIKLLWNHDTSAVLGSTRAGTLNLYEDEKGLRVEATLPNTTHGRDARELIKRKDVTGFSFGFTIPGRGGDEWNAEGTERTLKSVRLHEVSLTPFPAYTATNGTAQVRGLDKLAKRAEVDADALADSLIKLEQGEEITSADRDLLMKVIDSVSPVAPAPLEEVVDNSLELLALKKKKLDLLAKVL